MVCIAAFVILLVIWLFNPVLHLLGKKKQADNISKLFKKSMHCFTRRVTLRPCDSNFKDDIKDSVLSKLIVRHKKWVKPVSIGIEVSAAVIVLITVWSVLTVAKSGLALYVYGTCDVRTPDSCALSTTEACSIDSVGSGNLVVDWFGEWGEVLGALPARVQTWNAEEFVPENSTYYGEFSATATPENVAINIFDPGCIICRRSFVNQEESGFFDSYKTYLIPYVITGETGDKFKNSQVVAEYIEAVRGRQPASGEKVSAEWIIAEKIFYNEDENGDTFQEAFNGTAARTYSEEKTKTTIESWLKDAGFSDEEITEISEYTKSDEVAQKLAQNRDLVENQIKTKRIPTMIFDGKKHEGLYKAS